MKNRSWIARATCFPILSYTLNGTGGQWIELERRAMVFGRNNYLRFYFGQSGMELQEIKFELQKEIAGFFSIKYQKETSIH